MEYKEVQQRINDVVGDNVKKLAQLFPSAVKDGEVDFEALKEELGQFKEVSGEKYEQPVDYISQLLSILSGADSVILDFFSGSGTTAHAVIKLNAEKNESRKFIMIQLAESTDENSVKGSHRKKCQRQQSTNTVEFI